MNHEQKIVVFLLREENMLFVQYKTENQYIDVFNIFLYYPQQIYLRLAIRPWLRTRVSHSRGN